MMKSKGEGILAKRILGGWYGNTVKVIAASFSLFYLYTNYFGLISTQTHVGFYFLGSFVLCMSLYRATKKSPQNRISIFDGLFILGVTIVIIYYIREYLNVHDRLGEEPLMRDVIAGWFLIIMSIELARRVVRRIIPLISIIFLIYAHFGPYFPLGLGHSGFSLSRIAENIFWTTEGILGMVTNTFASYLLIFVILGSFMEVSGCGKVFVQLAYLVTGKITGGPGLASVITSALFGTISGSAVANVVVDGVFTIPLMKRLGYPSHFAGAVEAATSTGGQIMPPVMASAAFLMAEITGTPYIEIIKIAAIPACLYFLSVGVIIYLEARKRGLLGLPSSDLPKFREVVREIHLLLPIPVLILFLALGFAPLISAFYTIIATVLLSWVKKSSRMGPHKILEALVKGAFASLSVGATVGVIGIIMAVTNLTGLSNYFTQFVTYLSGGHLFLLILLIVIAGFCIGMGLPTTPSYVILVILGVAALTKMGVSTLHAHLLVLWVAVQNAVTPPVALAAFAAAAIAESDPWKTGWTATKLASWIYLMPFLFIYTSILKIGWNFNFILTVANAVIATVAWGGALEGYLFRKTTWIERLCLFGSAIGLLHEGIVTDLIGVILLVGVLISQKVWPSKAPEMVPNGREIETKI